jgi:hypothetical protein
MTINYIVYALGKRGNVKGKVFVPYRDADGSFPIFSEQLKSKNGSDKIQKAENMVFGVNAISEAVKMIRTKGFHWRLKEYDTGQQNIYGAKDIVIREV